MLKTSIFSPARPQRAGTRLFTYSVLASFRASTLDWKLSRDRNHCWGFSVRQDQFYGERPTRSVYLLGPSLTAPCWTDLL